MKRPTVETVSITSVKKENMKKLILIILLLAPQASALTYISCEDCYVVQPDFRLSCYVDACQKEQLAKIILAQKKKLIRRKRIIKRLKNKRKK